MRQRASPARVCHPQPRTVDDAAHPHTRAQWHARYDAYLRDEVIPFSVSLNSNPFLITAGASFGAEGPSHPRASAEIAS